MNRIQLIVWLTLFVIQMGAASAQPAMPAVNEEVRKPILTVDQAQSFILDQIGEEGELEIVLTDSSGGVLIEAAYALRKVLTMVARTERKRYGLKPGRRGAYTTVNVFTV